MDDEKHAGELLAEGRAARESRSRGAASKLNTVSRPPKDGRPDLAQVSLDASDVKAIGVRPIVNGCSTIRLLVCKRTRDQRKDLLANYRRCLAGT